MIPLIEVMRGGDLEREVYTFIVFENFRVYLEGYAKQTRKTKRHKFRNLNATYSRIGYHRHWEGKWEGEEPFVPAEVRSAAIKQFSDKLEFRNWKGDRR